MAKINLTKFFHGQSSIASPSGTWESRKGRKERRGLGETKRGRKRERRERG
jgi:hypothetical protein